MNYKPFPSDSRSKISYILREQNFYTFTFKEDKDQLDTYFPITLFGGMSNARPTLDPQFFVLAKKYKDYIFDDILFIVDKISFYKFVVPIVNNAEVPSAQIPLVANSSDCTRINYYFGTETPGSVTSTSTAVKSKCITPRMRFNQLTVATMASSMYL